MSSPSYAAITTRGRTLLRRPERFAGLPRRILLHLDLTTLPRDGAGSGGPPQVASALLGGSGPRLTLRQVVETLEQAAVDPRVVGLVARVAAGEGGGVAVVQELRDAVGALRAAGRATCAHAETFGDLGPGTAGYYLASAFERVYLQPTGEVGLVGVAAEVTFLRGALDKAGVDPQLEGRYEYKNARDQLTERGFTEAHREALGRVVDSVFDQVLAGVAQGRGLDPDVVRALVDRAPLSSSEALAAGLVDALCYRDEALDAARDRVGRDAALLPLAAYRTRTATLRKAGLRRGPVVALVHGSGAIATGRSRPTRPGGAGMGSDTVTAALRQAGADPDVRGLLFRVNSPGGSAVASDAIRREVARLRAAGRPVVVSMGDVAASGGYWVSMDADRIVAQPGTLTGSIGVLAGKAVTMALRERLGLATEGVQAGAHARIASGAAPFTAGEWERVRSFLDRVYADFVTRVAEGRGLTETQVHEVARGRVWTGVDAAERGLVDVLGGYSVAVGQLRRLLDLRADAPVRLRAFPRPTPLAARLLRGSSDPAEQAPAPAPAAVAAAGVAAELLDLLPAGLAHLAGDLLEAAEPARVLALAELPDLRW